LLTYPLGEEEREEEETYSKAYDVKKSLQHILKKSWEYRPREETNRTDRRTKLNSNSSSRTTSKQMGYFRLLWQRCTAPFEALQEHKRTDSTQK
jgi:hypothetical protein